MNAEEFLRARTGRCEKLHMNLTPEACADIRARPDKFVDGPPPQCAHCPGVQLANNCPATGQNPDTIKEVVMPEPGAQITKTYTLRELADLVGVNFHAVKNARWQRYGNSRPDSARGKVIAWMAEQGITWMHIISEPRGVKPKKPIVNKDFEAAFDAPAATPAPDPVVESPPVEMPAAAQAPEIAQSPPVVRFTPRDTEIAQAPPVKVFTLPPPAPAAVDLGAMPLELLIGEIKRRLPAAHITLEMRA